MYKVCNYKCQSDSSIVLFASYQESLHRSNDINSINFKIKAVSKLTVDRDDVYIL